MSLPNWPKKCLLVQVPSAQDPDALAMAAIYIRAAGTGMQEFFTKILPLFTDVRPFGLDPDGVGHRWSPLMTDSSELSQADAVIQSWLSSSETTDAFGTPMTVMQIVLGGLSGLLGTRSPVAPAEYKHADIGFVKVGLVFDTPEANSAIEARIDEWLSAYGSGRFTATGHTLDGNGRPVLLSEADTRAWLSAQISSQKLLSRSGVLLKGAA